MNEARVDIQVDARFRVAMAKARLEETLATVAETALDREHKSGPDRITLVISDDATLRRLNREFMGFDEPTDVLAFNSNEVVQTAQASTDPALNSEEWPVSPEDGAATLGEIVISYERAQEQAAAAGHDVSQEMAVLTAHGVLHLLGYDHAVPDEERVMFGKTDEILASAGVSGVPEGRSAGG